MGVIFKFRPARTVTVPAWEGIPRYRARVYSSRLLSTRQDRRMGRKGLQVWHYEVRNIQTGEIVATDNTGSLEKIHDAAARTVVHAEAAWMNGWLQ